jgi:hypothetical protein
VIGGTFVIHHPQGMSTAIRQLKNAAR